MAAQSLLDAKTKARNIESTCDSLLPLVEDDITKRSLEEVAANARLAAQTFDLIYKRCAREAFAS